MSDHSSHPRLTVDLGALSRNADTLRALARGAELAPVVKADCYGLGAARIVPHLVSKCGIRTLFVAYASEALALVDEVPDAVFYVLNGYAEEEASAYDHPRIRPVLNSIDQARAWAGKSGPVALSVDVGMNRLGFSGEDAGALPDAAGIAPDAVDLIYMHLSHGGSPEAPENEAQIEKFRHLSDELRSVYPEARFSLSASGGLFLDMHPAEALVRPGVALYGGAADGDPAHALETVATLTAPVLMTRTVTAGETVGYNGRWRAQRDSHLAILSIGYADGYHRRLTNKGVVHLGGTECPVVGTVSMDLLAVDITDAPNPVTARDQAELFGERIKVDRLATLADTIAYELFTSVGPRVERVYKG